MTIFDVLNETDWTMLRDQKRALLTVVDSKAIDPAIRDHMEGVLNWLDAIQDAAADEHGYPVQWLTEE